MFFNSLYFTLRKMAINPTTGGRFTSYYGAANPSAFFTRPHRYSPQADIDITIEKAACVQAAFLISYCVY
jgi:hypothetical protein